jgi:hypothetical protein
MSQLLRQSITELEARAKQYEAAALQSRQAAQQLRALLQRDAPVSRSTQTTKATAPKKSTAKASSPKTATKTKAKPATKRAAKSNGKPTLATAIHHVLETRQREKAGGVKATQLYDEIQQAGYRFAGTNQKNNMTYLYKILRKNKAGIKHSADGLFSLA